MQSTHSKSSRKSPAVPLHAQFVRRSVPYDEVCDNNNYDDEHDDDDDDEDDDDDVDFSPSISSIASLQLP